MLNVLAMATSISGINSSIGKMYVATCKFVLGQCSELTPLLLHMSLRRVA